MASSVNVSGTWKTISSIGVNVSSAWKTVSAGYINVGGVWKQFHSSAPAYTISVPTHNALSEDELFAVAGITFTTYAVTTSTGEANSTWASPTTGNPGDYYEIYAHKLSGNTPTGDALNTWLPLSTDRSWALSRANPPGGVVTCSLEISIGLLGTSTALSTATCSITAAPA